MTRDIVPDGGQDRAESDDEDGGLPFTLDGPRDEDVTCPNGSPDCKHAPHSSASLACFECYISSGGGE